ncbi:hypothetical protein TNCV_4387651 [Trichonephila clavipes]|nr:hypothetical protein TNCV_4387651 [Trichonephila clavipes]
MLAETWLDNDECVSIPNFDCCVQFKRPGHRIAGVAIYRYGILEFHLIPRSPCFGSFIFRSTQFVRVSFGAHSPVGL